LNEVGKRERTSARSRVDIGDQDLKNETRKLNEVLEKDSPEYVLGYWTKDER